MNYKIIDKAAPALAESLLWKNPSLSSALRTERLRPRPTLAECILILGGKYILWSRWRILTLRNFIYNSSAQQRVFDFLPVPLQFLQCSLGLLTVGFHLSTETFLHGNKARWSISQTCTDYCTTRYHQQNACVLKCGTKDCFHLLCHSRRVTWENVHKADN